jgi:hypothetical protein
VCGGSPIGVWNTNGSCEFKTNRQDQPLSPDELIALPVLPVLTSSPVAPTTAGDQCSQLIYLPVDSAGGPNTKIKSINLWHDAPALTTGQVTYKDDTTYAISLKFAGYNVSHFSPYCLQSAGANPSCSDLVANLTQYYSDKSTADAAGNKSPDFANIACAVATDGGCDCGYDYQVTLADIGTWHPAGSVITQSSDPSGYTLNGRSAGSQRPTSAMASSICVAGDQLTLSGYNGSPLFHVPGLRVLTLHK